MQQVILKPGREKAALHRHPWIFSGAIASAPPDLSGQIYPVFSAKGEQLGSAYFNSRSQLIGRFVAFGLEPPEEAIERHIQEALQKRHFGPETTAYRLINGEGDFLPGLIVDRYHDLTVVQVGTLGMEKLKPLFLPLLPGRVYEKSLLPSRKEEGLAPLEGWLRGVRSTSIEVLEEGLRFHIDVKEGQKTGFFLDQRENRKLIRSLSYNKKVLNLFSYTGGFTVAALAGGALRADSVDISAKACQLAEENIKLNGFAAQKVMEADVFEFLRQESLPYDLVILDPPAFAKRQKDVVQACRGYKDINRLALKKMPKNGLLLTCSCSHFVEEALFQKVLFQAAVEAKREVQIIGKHRLAADHPLNIFHPEGDYLKSFLLSIHF